MKKSCCYIQIPLSTVVTYGYVCLGTHSFPSFLWWVEKSSFNSRIPHFEYLGFFPLRKENKFLSIFFYSIVFNFSFFCRILSIPTVRILVQIYISVLSLDSTLSFPLLPSTCISLMLSYTVVRSLFQLKSEHIALLIYRCKTQWARNEAVNKHLPISTAENK